MFICLFICLHFLRFTRKNIVENGKKRSSSSLCACAMASADLNIADICRHQCVCACATAYVCLPACVCVCVHSLCLFSVQQNLINSAGMEIISAPSAQETERDGEKTRGEVGGGGTPWILKFLYFSLLRIIQLKKKK